MNAVLGAVLAMSLSGGLLILALLLGGRLWKDKVSRQWQYYIWLVVIARLLLPFAPETNLLGSVCRSAGQAAVQAALPRQSAPALSEDAAASAGDGERSGEAHPAGEPAGPLRQLGALLAEYAWLVWLGGALGLLIRRVTVYQGFARYVRAGAVPVSDTALLDRLSAAAERAGVRRPVELWVDPLISSPLLLGFFRPCIVLPSADIPEADFPYVVLHELVHYRRRDVFYKWLAQAAVCLHWFNPLVHLMGREITRACELSCDEAVLAAVGPGHARDYGNTLLDAMAAVGRYREHPGAVTLSENKQLLKERLGAIMNFRKKSAAVRFLTGALTACVVFGAAFIGLYPAAAASDGTPAKPPASGLPGEKGGDSGQGEDGASEDKNARMAERYYEAGSLPLFQIAFARLGAESQGQWLERIYEDEDIAFLGAALNGLADDCPQILHLAETVYGDGDIVFFSALAMHMSEGTLEQWLDRALEDGNWTFQSVLFHLLDQGDAWDEQKEKEEKEWEEAQRAEYAAVGVTVDGKDYYYRGQLVNIFLDIRSNKSFYTLNMNPKGTVNLKILRDGNNEITGAAYLTDAEVTELFGDMEDPDEDGELLPVDLETVAAGESVFLGEYALSEGDEIRYDISAETGNRMKVFFAREGREDAAFWSVNNLRQPGEALTCTAEFTVGPPAAPGTYRLYLQAPDGALGNVAGSVFIGR